MEYANPQKRKKKKEKAKERKKHPYKKGGKHRTTKLEERKKQNG